MDCKLTCNYKSCQAQLSSTAWVTSCFHIFCNDHNPKYEDDKKCPLCLSDLSGNFDIIERDLNPSEDYKLIVTKNYLDNIQLLPCPFDQMNHFLVFVLAGMNPSTILDIGSRAIQFWNFQNYQEKLYMSSTVRRMRTRFAQAESSYESVAEKLRNKIQMEEQKIENLKKELDDYKKKTQILEEKLQKSEMKNQQLYNIAVQKKQHAQHRVQPNRDSFKRSLNISSPELDFVHSQRAPQTPRSGYNFHPMSSQNFRGKYETTRKYL